MLPSGDMPKNAHRNKVGATQTSVSNSLDARTVVGVFVPQHSCDSDYIMATDNDMDESYRHNVVQREQTGQI